MGIHYLRGDDGSGWKIFDCVETLTDDEFKRLLECLEDDFAERQVFINVVSESDLISNPRTLALIRGEWSKWREMLNEFEISGHTSFPTEFNFAFDLYSSSVGFKRDLIDSRSHKTVHPEGQPKSKRPPPERDTSLENKEDQWFSSAPDLDDPTEARFEHGPLVGELKDLALWTKKDRRTLRLYNGSRFWYVRIVHSRSYELYLDNKQRHDSIKRVFEIDDPYV